MSIEVMVMIFKRYPVGGNEGYLAHALADHCEDDGTSIYPSVALLARKTKMDERTVRRYLRKMEASRWLLRVSSATGRPGKPNEYAINPDWIAGKDFPLTGGDLPPVQDSKVLHTGGNLPPVLLGETGGNTEQRGDTAAPPESSRTLKNPIPLTPFEKGAEGFTEFADQYPRRSGRRRALREWIRIAPDARLRADMTQALRAWQESPEWQRDCGQYIPGLAKWLVDRRWLDAPGTATTPNPSAITVREPPARAAAIPPEVRARIDAILGRAPKAVEVSGHEQ